VKGATCTVEQWIAQIEEYAKKPFDECTLRDLVDRGVPDALGVLMMDAAVMANAVGATNTARPEDIEIHPFDQSVYIAFTDSTGSGEGSPDARIFPDSKGENSRQYGAIYRIIENNNDPAARTFGWGKFVSSGETHEGGGAFASADNMVFDPQGNLWIVSDITTPKHNYEVTREDATKPGSASFMGAFGNNAMFCIATQGEHAGTPRCFAIGPMECEMTGPTWTDDGRTLIVSIQHPGELHGTRGLRGVGQTNEVTRTFKLADRGGTLFDQERVVPLGSNFPARQIGIVPRPCVLCITSI
jgi:secreted PhoX family phosphatase